MRQGSSLAVVWGEILANTKVGGQKPLKFKIGLVEENNKSPPKKSELGITVFKTVIQWLHLICILSFFLVSPWTFWENWPMMVAQSSSLAEFCLWWIFFVAPLLPRKGWMDVAKTHPFRLPARETFKNTGLLVPWKSNHHSLQVGLRSTLFYSNGLLSFKRKHHFLNGGWLPRCMFDWSSDLCGQIGFHIYGELVTCNWNNSPCTVYRARWGGVYNQVSGQIIATSAEVTPNWWFSKGMLQKVALIQVQELE